MSLAQYILNKTKSAFKSEVRSIWPSMCPVLQQYKSYLDQSITYADELISDLSSVSELFDYNVSVEAAVQEEIHDVVIEADLANSLSKGVADIISTSSAGVNDTLAALNLTVSDGSILAICPCDEQFDGNRILLKTIPSDQPVQNMRQVLLYQFQGNYYIKSGISAVSPTNHIASMPYVIKSLVDSMSINEVLSTAIKCLSSKQFDMITFTSKLDYLKRRPSAATGVYQHLIESYSVGGIYGVAQGILQYYGKAKTMNVGPAGYLQFTDNAGLIPQQYISGIICTVAGYAAQLLGGIAYAFNASVGAILSLVGSLLTAVPKAFNYDFENNTNAAVNAEADYPIFPLGTFQQDIDITVPEYMSLKDVYNIVNASGLCFCIVPGGYIFFGFGPDENILRCEFHPSVQYYPWFVNTTSTGGIFTNVNLSVKTSTGETLLTALDNGWNESVWNRMVDKYGGDASSSTFDTMIPASEDGVLSTASDVWTRMICVYNTIVFLTWFTQISGSWTIHDYNNVDVRSAFKIQADAALTPEQQLKTGYPMFLGGLTSNISNQITWCICFDYLMARMNIRFWYYSDTGSLIEAEGPSTLRIVPSVKDQFPSWADIVKWFTNNLSGSNLSISVFGSQPNFTNLQSFSQAHYCSNVCSTSAAEGTVFIDIPKYDRRTFWIWVAAAVGVTAVIVGVSAIFASKTKKSIQKLQSNFQSGVESAWTTYIENRTAENYQKYRSAVKKNNFFASIFGGTKYDYVNYWGGSSDSSVNADFDSSELNELLNTVLTRIG